MWIDQKRLSFVEKAGTIHNNRKFFSQDNSNFFSNNPVFPQGVNG